MKKIAISGNKGLGMFALVDDEDYERINGMGKWCLNGDGYAMRQMRVNGKQRSIYMSIVVFGSKPGFVVDHKNLDKLDNRKENLRHCTVQQNSSSQKVSVKNTSGYRGVTKGRYTKAFGQRWEAVTVILVDGKRKSIYGGCFKTKEEAALRYNELALKYRGEFAKLNEV